ncbi:MAG: DUF6079 family protein [Dehalococcoidia bacterium]
MTLLSQPFPWIVTLGGVEHRGEIFVGQSWSEEMGETLGPGPSRFRIVVLTSPSQPAASSIKDPSIGVWAPSTAVAETQAIYQVEGTEAGLESLITHLNSLAYLQGRVYTSQGPRIAIEAKEPRTALDRLATILLLGAAREYVAILVEDLPSISDDPDTIYQGLQHALQGHQEDVRGASQELNRLTEGLNSSLAQRDRQVLDRLLQLADIAGPVDFATQARELYGETAGFALDVEVLNRLEELAGLAQEILSAFEYLEGVSLRREDRELSVDLLSIKGQFNMAQLSERPQLWSNVQEMFRWFRSRYVTLYLKHHRDFYGETAPLHEAFKSASLQVEALDKLNSLQDLGTPLGADLPGRYEEMLGRLELCTSEEGLETALQTEPTCPQCRILLSSTPPSREAQQYLNQLREALEEQCRRLSRLAARRILSEQARGRLGKLIRIAQVSDLTSLVNVLDDDVVGLLRDLLREPAL